MPLFQAPATESQEMPLRRSRMRYRLTNCPARHLGSSVRKSDKPVHLRVKVPLPFLIVISCGVVVVHNFLLSGLPKLPLFGSRSNTRYFDCLE